MDERFLIDRALDVLRSGGADGDVFVERRRSLALRVREGRLDEISRAEACGLAIRAMREGRLGFAHTSALDVDGIARSAAKALELAGSASPREDLALADPTGPGDGRDEGEGLNLYDSSIERRGVSEKQEWVRSVEAIARGVDAKIRRTDGASYHENLAGYWIANTKGLFRHYQKSHLEVGVQVVAEDQGQMQTGELGTEAIRWEELPEPGELGRRAGERALRLLGGRPVATGRYPVVFSPEAGYALLVYLALALRGDHLSRGRSWLSGRADAMLASPQVTIRDDGRHVRGPASVPFDAEGIDTRGTLLLEGGKVCGSLRDLASGKRLGLPSTGNAHREGYERLPEIAATNLYLVPGPKKVEQVLAPVGKGLWAWGLTGWRTGLDPSNPRLSCGAFGLWLEGGKPTQPVARVTISGSFQEILGGIEEIADDLVWDHPTKTPTFRVSALSVSGV